MGKVTHTNLYRFRFKDTSYYIDENLQILYYFLHYPCAIFKLIMDYNNFGLYDVYSLSVAMVSIGFPQLKIIALGISLIFD